MNENEKLISVIDAATQLAMRKQTPFKIIKRLGLSTVKQRNSTHRNQMISYIAKSDLALVVRDASARADPKEGVETQNCEQLHTEVFRTKDIAQVKAMCEQFFSLMPSLDEVKGESNFAFT